MRVLWLSTYPSLYKSSQLSNYNGEGWVASLQRAVEEADAGIELGIAFPYPAKENRMKEGNVTYYPVPEPKVSYIQKLLYYWGGYRHETGDTYLNEVQKIISDFKPDVIHVFGIESPFAVIIGKTDIPVAVHIQGVLNPCFNAFFPPGMNRYTFLFKKISINEWLFRNGYNFAVDEMAVRSQRELALFKNIKYFMGRTGWDFQISRFFSPDSEYFHVNEILRPAFYDAHRREIPDMGKFVIVSTISQTVYKGLDVILKAARLLKHHTDLDFEWRVIGVSNESRYVRVFEKNYGIKGADVHVKYAGVMNAGQICSNLLQAHVYVHPTYIDNSPNSLCEAQMVGMPVIGTYVGGIPSLITDGETGLTVPANAPHEIACLLQYLQQNPDVMSRLGKSAREIALSRHSKENTVAGLISVYNRLKN